MDEPIIPTGPIKPIEPADPVERTYPDAPDRQPINNAQKTVALLIAAFFIGAVLYKLILHESLGQTAAMFIGIPAVLAIALALSPRPQSAKGSILRGIALFLLVIAPLLGEGYLCIIIASPLFFLVGLIVGALIDSDRASRGTTLSCIAFVLLPFTLEGVVPQLTHNRAQSVTVTQVVSAPVEQVEAAIAHTPDITTPLPRFLRIGFPRPLETRGGGFAVNDTRTIHFAGAEGDPPGDLVMRVAASRPGYLRLVTVSDSSKLTQWLRWQSSDVTWTPIDATHTRVSCQISFDRQLDPFWYFAPWEQFAVRQTAKYLIAANATPRK